MATVKTLSLTLLLLLAATNLPKVGAPAAIAVEYELDTPLDLRQKWSFLREEDFFIQHQCGAAGGTSAAKKIKNILTKETPLRKIATVMRPFQVRLLRDFSSYRRTFRFSKDRHAHYSEKLSLITSYCGASGVALEEHLILHRLAEIPLRLWQKVFIAETLPFLDGDSNFQPFADAAKIKPRPLRYLLLSNHRPEKPERATLRHLVAFLQKEKKAREFVTALLGWREFDDTATEILENLFSTPVQQLEERITPTEIPKTRNNTLPGRK